MSRETLSPPIGDLPDRLKTANGLTEAAIRQKFGIPLEVVKTPGVDEIISRPEVGTIIFKNPKVTELKFSQAASIAGDKSLAGEQSGTLTPKINIDSTPVKVDIKPGPAKAEEPEKPIDVGPDLLKGTGFTPLEEMHSLKTKYNEGLAKGEDPEQLKNRIITENITNIRWYQWEYTMSDPVLPNPVALNEKGELVNSKSGYSIVDMTNEEEREGAVKLSVIRAQELLKNAKEGETIVIISPPKWTGRKTAEGVAIEYPEAELFTYKKGKGRNIRAVTLIAELSIEQCQEVSDHFIKPESSPSHEELSPKERIKRMVSNPILIKDINVTAEHIVDVVQHVKGGDIMREANGANRTFTEAQEALARGDEFQKLPDICEGIIETYEKYLRDNFENINDPEVYAAINQRMQLTVLEIAKTLKGDGKSGAAQEVSFFYKQAMASNNVIDQKIVQKNYDEQIAYLMTRPGCNGGGSARSSMGISSQSSPLSGGSSSEIGGGSGLSKEGGICVMCNTKNECTERCYKCGGMLTKE